MNKSITRKHQKLRDSARGEECTLAIHPYCNGDPTTVVLCHLPSGSGTGQKSPDWFAVYGCSSCHDIIDGRFPNSMLYKTIKEDIPEFNQLALFRTWSRMIEKGLIKI